MVTIIARKLSAGEFFELEDDGRRLELVQGDVVEMPDGGERHGSVGENISYALQRHVRDHSLGKVFLSGTGFALGPDLVRKPDVAFVRAERCHEPPSDRWFEGAPDLAVEVISPADTWSEVEAKAQEYLDHGVAEVWLVSPFSRTVQIWRREEKPAVRSGDDRLETPLLAGFSVRISDLFL